MHLDATTIAALAEELQPLVGARVQRIDEIDTDELVLELRCPGRTFRLLVSGRRGAARVHLVAARPPRLVRPSGLQGSARKNLEGRPVRALAATDAGFLVGVPGATLEVALDGRRKPVTVREEESFTAREVAGRVPERFPLSESIEARASASLGVTSDAKLRRAVIEPLEKGRRRLERLVKNLDLDLEKLTGLEAKGRHAELLKPLIGRVPRGAAFVDAFDFATSETVRVPLDPALDVKANMERSFSSAKRGARGRVRVTERRALVEAELRRIESLIAIAKEAPAADLPGLLGANEPSDRSQREGGSNVQPGAAKKAPRDPLARHARRFVSLDGVEIRVGKGGEGNDRLTASARGHEVWLHARGVPGAHVVVRLEKNKSLTEATLLDAAHLAAYFSDAKNELKPEIVYTEARYVKKPKGAPPGRVTLSREKTLKLAVESARLDRLLEKDPTLRRA
ncbi:MAG: DUF814 domain-containing protein [Deltaproteobacteria bacterium]|nr:DUF814 domain-containing protein [Deltaproteobacteria bacterium]